MVMAYGDCDGLNCFNTVSNRHSPQGVSVAFKWLVRKASLATCRSIRWFIGITWIMGTCYQSDSTTSLLPESMLMIETEQSDSTEG